MAFPTTIQGSPGFEKTVTTARKHRIGQRMEFPDGRVFYYATSGEALTPGLLTMLPNPQTNHGFNVDTSAAASAGATQIALTNTNSAGNGAAVTGTGAYTGDFATAGTYEDGYAFVNDGAGQGQLFQIKDHSTAASGSGGTITIDFYDNDGLDTAVTTASEWGLRQALYSSVEIWDISDVDGSVAGVCPSTVASGSYFWCQTAGPASVLQSGAIVAGTAVVASIGGADGAIQTYDGDNSGNTYHTIVGTCIEVGTSDTEYALIDLQVRY